MSCHKKTKYTCGDTTYATCVSYQKELPEFTKIEDECYTIEETTEDTYILIGEIKDEIDLSELGKSCLEYVLDENDKIVVKNVLLKYEEEICNLLEEIDTLKNRPLCEMLIGDCVDTLCLELPCEDEIVTFGDWMNAITARVCAEE